MSDYKGSEHWHYVRAGDYRKCDVCSVIHLKAGLERVQLHGQLIDRCKDKGRCALWKAELARGARP